MKNVKVHVLFGKEAVRSVDADATMENAPKAAEDHGGSFDTYEFETKGEAAAFVKGLDAADGWEDYAVVLPLVETEEAEIIA